MKLPLDRIPFKQVQWLLPLVVTLHNLEEALWLPNWSKDAGRWHPPVGPREFRFAVSVLTGMLYLITYGSIKGGPESRRAYLFNGTAFMMLLNVIFPHAVATVLLQKYAPGVVTGVLLNLPVTLYLLRRAFREQYVSKERFPIAAVGVSLGTLPLLPLLFFIGKYIDRVFLGSIPPKQAAHIRSK